MVAAFIGVFLGGACIGFVFGFFAFALMHAAHKDETVDQDVEVPTPEEFEAWMRM